MIIDVRNVVAVDGSFSSRLRSLLVEHGMSQAELARRTGINYAALTATVNGRRRPTAREVGLLAHELRVDLLEFIGIADTVAEHGVLIE
jgi:transcriptional regulator with XRE-family HTH domain